MSYEGPQPFPVHSGGSGDSSHTAYSVLCGGTTSTAAVQSVSGLGSSGQVLTSNGASALPTWQSGGAGAVITVAIQSFTSSGTYTPTSGMIYCIIECQGGGGGGGGGNNSQSGAGGGGGAGGYSRGVFSSGTIGVSQTVTINSGGGGNSGAAGSTGGSVSVGALISANGGTGGGTPSGGPSGTAGTGGTATGGTVNITGGTAQAGQNAANAGTPTYYGGIGSNSMFGVGGSTVAEQSSHVAGKNATGFGAGGGGGAASDGTNTTGGSGTNGIIIITEYCN